MKWLYLYIIDGFPAIAISYRPLDALHTTKRVYYKLTGSTICRFFAVNHNFHHHLDKSTGMYIYVVILQGGAA